MKKDSYIILEKEETIICKDYFDGYYLCLYSNCFKVEDKLLIPSIIHYSEDNYVFRDRDKFDSFSKYNFKDYTKIYLVKSYNIDIFICQIKH